MAKFGADKVEREGVDQFLQYRLCPGCRRPLEAVIFVDETGAHDREGIRPWLGLFGWCGCRLLAPDDPEGWKRVGDQGIPPAMQEVYNNATDDERQVMWAEVQMIREKLRIMRPPLITTCPRCNSRRLVVMAYSHRRSTWEVEGEIQRCRGEVEAYLAREEAKAADRAKRAPAAPDPGGASTGNAQESVSEGGRPRSRGGGGTPPKTGDLGGRLT